MGRFQTGIAGLIGILFLSFKQLVLKQVTASFNILKEHVNFPYTRLQKHKFQLHQP